MEAKATIKNVCAIVFGILLFTSMAGEIWGRPSATEIGASYDEYETGVTIADKRLEQCDKDDDLMELCLRCAKVTKSNIVFPMCCGNEDNAGTWCREYVYYGIQ